MFKRIDFADWTGFVPEVSFWLTFSVFLAIAIRAIFLKKRKIRDMSEMPFKEEQPVEEEEDKS
jgi:hypothetical protein